MISLFCTILACLSQMPDEFGSPPVNYNETILINGEYFHAKVIDWSMAEAQEDFVFSATGITPTTISRFLPSAAGVQARRLNSDCYICRRQASKRLATLCKNTPHFLFWLLRDRRPEVRMRACIILRKQAACGMCNGIGYKREAWGDAKCYICDSTGSLWHGTF